MRPAGKKGGSRRGGHGEPWNVAGPLNDLLSEGSKNAVRPKSRALFPLVEAGPEVAASILSSPRAVEIFVNSADPRLLVQVYRRVRDRMESAARRELLRRAVGRIARIALNLWETRRAKKPSETRGYRPGDPEWDLDASLERMNRNPGGFVTYDDFRTQADDPSRMAVCLMIDKSQSVSGVLHDVAVACAMVCYALRDEMMSVLVFDKAVEFIRRFDDSGGPEQIIEKIVDMDCGGATDLFKPLLAAQEELAKVPASHTKRGVLVSDLVATRGNDPLRVAEDLASLRVVCVPGFRVEAPDLAFSFANLPNVECSWTPDSSRLLDALLNAALS